MKTKPVFSRIILLMFIVFILVVAIPLANIVSAAVPITLEDWESYNAGVSSGTGTYGSWERTSGNVVIANTALFPSGTKCLAFDYSQNNIYDRVYYNLTTDFSYIGSISLLFEMDYIAAGLGTDKHNYITFYNDTIPMIELDIRWDDTVDDAVEFLYRDGAGVWQELYQSLFAGTPWDDINIYWNMTAGAGNAMTYNLWFEGVGDVANDVASTYYIGDWATFDQIYFNGHNNLNKLYHFYLDDITIDTTYSGSPDDIPEGYLGVNCYNESDGSNLTDFNVLFVNQDGDIYYDYAVNNTWIVWGDLLPQGDNVMITVSKNNYYPRTYTLDIVNGYFVIDGTTYTDVIIDAYLPDINISTLYYIQVIDEYLQSVEDAFVNIQGWCGNTSYQNVSNTITDGYGYTNAYLLWGEQYQVTINKSGYTSKTATWIPDASKYGIEYPKVFKIYLDRDDIIEYDPFSIIVTGTMLSNNSILVTYSDSNSSTVNWTIQVFEVYNGTWVLNSTTNSTNNTESYYVTGVNITRKHMIRLSYNNSANFAPTWNPPLYYDVWPIDIFFPGVTPFDIEDRFNDIFGEFELGWTNLFSIILAIVILASLSPFNVGVAVIGSGMGLGFTQAIFLIYFTNTFNVLLVTLIPVLIFIGIIYLLSKGEGGIHL